MRNGQAKSRNYRPRGPGDYGELSEAGWCTCRRRLFRSWDITTTGVASAAGRAETAAPHVVHPARQRHQQEDPSRTEEVGAKQLPERHIAIRRAKGVEPTRALPASLVLGAGCRCGDRPTTYPFIALQPRTKRRGARSNPAARSPGCPAQLQNEDRISFLNIPEPRRRIYSMQAGAYLQGAFHLFHVKRRPWREHILLDIQARLSHPSTSAGSLCRPASPKVGKASLRVVPRRTAESSTDGPSKNLFSCVSRETSGGEKPRIAISRAAPAKSSIRRRHFPESSQDTRPCRSAGYPVS